MKPNSFGSLTEPEIDALVERQIAGWRGTRLERRATQERFGFFNAAHLSVFIFEASKRQIRIRPKPAFTFWPGLEKVQAAQSRRYLHRAQSYRAFLERALARAALDDEFSFAIDVSDGPVGESDLPIFAFQKTAGSRHILLPDVDFFRFSWYRSIEDKVRYHDKSITGCFVGSSTGGQISGQAIMEKSLPRLRAASHFVGSPLVTFSIASAVQCQTPRAEALLRAQPYFSGRLDWPAQFKHRFLLSLDGNGAACSRIAIALKSNCVPIKFSSPFGLYYFDAAVAGRHYLEVGDEREVEPLIELERTRPGYFAEVAAAGTAFFHRYLSLDSVLAYASALLTGCARL